MDAISIYDEDFRKNFSGAFLVPDRMRATALEAYLIKRAKVELKLLSTLGTSEIRLWLPEACAHGNTLRLGHYLVVTRDCGQSLRAFNRKLRENIENLRRHERTVMLASSAIEPREALLGGLREITRTLHEHACALSTQARDLMANRSSFGESPRYYLGQIFVRDANVFTLDERCGLLSLYMALNDYLRPDLREEVAVEVLAATFSIGDAPLSESGLPSKRAWIQCVNGRFFAGAPAIPGGAVRRFFDFRGKHGQLTHRAVEIELSGASVILPLTYWMRRGCEKVYPFFIPFAKPYPLYHSWQVGQCGIVCLTDSLEIADVNQLTAGPAIAWASWYGGLEAVPDVNWEPLRGKRVYYFLARHSGYPEKTVYATAMAVHDKLKDIAQVMFIDARHGVDVETMTT